MKSTNTFGVRFIIRHTKDDQSEACIYARITVNKKRLEISLKRTVNPAYWNGPKGCVQGNKDLARKINSYIEEVRYKLMECYQQVSLRGTFINTELVKNVFLGEERKESTLCSLILYHGVHTKTTLRPGTLKNYGATEKYLRLFLKERYKTSDVPLCELNYRFITEFELFLRTTKPLDESNPLGNNGVMKHMERFRKMVTLAVKIEWIPKDPFSLYKLRFQKTEREFLIEEEIQELENLEPPSARIDRCRDLFLFSCYTGLAYIDLQNLGPNNIVIGIDGEYWLRTFRQKTDAKVSVPLLPQAKALLTKYKANPAIIQNGRIMPSISNQKVNDGLKELAKLCGIKKNMTYHLARHTFATTITLNNGIPIETVSKMLGHSKLSTTQIYVHVLERKISEDMKVLRNKFEAKAKLSQIAV